MIFVIPSLSVARIVGEEAGTPWRRWFAWYPINDDGIIYWLTRVEWRLVVGNGSMADGTPHTYRRYEYRHLKVTTTVAEAGINE